MSKSALSPKAKPGSSKSTLGAAGASLLSTSKPSAPIDPTENKGVTSARSTTSTGISTSNGASLKNGSGILSDGSSLKNGSAVPAPTSPTSPGVSARGGESASDGAALKNGSAVKEPTSPASPVASSAKPSARGKADSGAAATDSAAADESVPAEVVLKFHSAVRWQKPWEEIKAAAGTASLKAVCLAKDEKNGNTALHIASQNGHLDLVKNLISAGSAINGQNGKGQTPLHMCVEYDFYFVAKALIDAGADKELKNEEGHKAVEGIDGGKTGSAAWDNPVSILKSAATVDDLELAFTELEKALATPEIISKAELIQSGMQKKKAPATKDIWDHKRFMGLAAKF